VYVDTGLVEKMETMSVVEKMEETKMEDMGNTEAKKICNQNYCW
jgi:hypothetical protein